MAQSTSNKSTALSQYISFLDAQRAAFYIPALPLAKEDFDLLFHILTDYRHTKISLDGRHENGMLATQARLLIQVRPAASATKAAKQTGLFPSWNKIVMTFANQKSLKQEPSSSPAARSRPFQACNLSNDGQHSLPRLSPRISEQPRQVLARTHPGNQAKGAVAWRDVRE